MWSNIRPNSQWALLVGTVLGLLMWFVTSSANATATSANYNSSSALASTHHLANTGMGPKQIDISANLQELAGQYFYIDPGHGGDNPPGGESCYGTSATGPRGSREHVWALQIAFQLRAYLVSHGAVVYMSRTDNSNSAPCLTARVNDNNARHDQDVGVNGTNWRFISIHLNAPFQINKIEVFRHYDNIQPAGQELAQNAADWIEQAYPPDMRPVQKLVGAWTQGPGLYAVTNTKPFGYNILTESGYLTNPPFENLLIDTNGDFVTALATSHYRAVVDFWLVGYEGWHTTKHQGIVNEYWSNINAGNDPGVPFANGPSFFVHYYPSENRAWTQEFQGSGSIGSIIQPTAGGTAGAAYFVHNSIWRKYVQKNGPNSNGPGLPSASGNIGHEHDWTTSRGWRGNAFTYRAQNFEHGAITYNNYEGAISLPNCQAYDLDPSHWAYGYSRDMVNRFSLSNDQNRSGSYYPDGGIHATDTYSATRSQLAQILMLAEGYPYPGGNTPYFTDMQDHWGNPWVKMAAANDIITGYSCGGPGEPCDANNNPYFRPENPATRGQFSKMLALTRSPEWSLINPPSPHFTDVLYGSTFYTHIETALSYGIIGGYSCGGPGEPCDSQNRPYFRPGNGVTRPQVTKMVDLALTNSGHGPGGCWP